MVEAADVRRRAAPVAKGAIVARGAMKADAPHVSETNTVEYMPVMVWVWAVTQKSPLHALSSDTECPGMSSECFKRSSTFPIGIF